MSDLSLEELEKQIELRLTELEQAFNNHIIKHDRKTARLALQAQGRPAIQRIERNEHVHSQASSYV